MRRIKFLKMAASGNDFVIIDNCFFPSGAYHLGNLAKRLCHRKYGAGADGLLLLEKSRLADIRMRIFNPDGTEPEMCGNGARCAALYYDRERRTKGRNQRTRIETKAGILESEVRNDNVKIKMIRPSRIKLNIPIKINNRLIHINFIDTGVPHSVILVEGLEKIDVVGIGRRLRYHRKFKPRGTNVDFVEVLGDKDIKLRTYERGVEDETLACGTGAMASALIASRLSLIDSSPIKVHTRSGDVLKVYFYFDGNKFSNLWLEGKARFVYQGVYYV